MVPAGKSVEAPRLTKDTYVAADGTALPLRTWPAANGAAPKAVILGLHGFGDYRDAFEDPAAIWSKDGIATVAYDQRGFGQSPTRGRWAGTDTMVDDAKAVAVLLRRQYPDVPLYVAGESMGGAVAMVASDRGLQADGLILLAPAVRDRKSFGRLASAGAWFFSHTVPWLPIGPTSIDFQPTDNPKALEKLAKDPLMLRNPRVDITIGLLDLMDAGCAAAENIQMPYMLLHGMADRIVPSGPVREVIKLMPPRPDSKLAFYSKGHHLLLRDKEGPKVSADVASWMSNHEAPLPSGADGPTVQPTMLALWGSGRPGADATTTTAIKSD